MLPLLIVAGIIALFLPIITYLIDNKKLRKYPSASGLAAISPLWQIYHNRRGQKYLAVDRAHKDLGRIVRLGPTHLSFSSPTAFKDIYGHGTTLKKDVFYDNQAGGNPNMADATNKQVHRNKRKNLAHVFAPAQITLMEPRVQSAVKSLLACIEMKSRGQQVSDADKHLVRDGLFDLRPWLNMFSYDAITSVFWSQPYNFLATGSDKCSTEGEDGSISKVHAMSTFHNGAAHNVMLGHLAPWWYDLIRNKLLRFSQGTKSGSDFTDMARLLTKRRLQQPPTEPDLFSNLPTESARKGQDTMGLDELIAESSVMLNAGNDTTQTSLTNTMYFLASHPHIQDKLRRALHEALPASQIPLASYEHLRHVSYLQAVIDESFRLQPPLGTGLPRITTCETVIDGEVVQPGVTVSAQTWSLHRTETLFKHADQYIPERWLAHEDCDDGNNGNNNTMTSLEERRNLQDYVLPFSQGPRACIGRNLAYMELSVCITALVLAYEWSLPVSGFELRHHERFNCNPIELLVTAKKLQFECEEHRIIS